MVRSVRVISCRRTTARSTLNEPSPRRRISPATLLVAVTLLCMGAAGTANGATSYMQSVQEDRPAAYWRLGETSGSVARDVTGRRDGAYRGEPTFGQPGAISGDTAVSFDGIDDGVRLPAAPAVNPASGVSIELWVKRSGRGKQTLVVSRRGNAARFAGYLVGIDSANRVRATFADADRSVTVRSTSALDANWHHIVASYGDGAARLWVDAVRHDRQRIALSLAPGSQLRVGTLPSGRSRFAGMLDEVAIYRRALTRAQIAAHYAAATSAVTTAGPPDPPLSPPAPPVSPAPDTTPPTITLTTPTNGATVETTTPSIVGAAGTAPGDVASVTVRIYDGARATGDPIRTLTAPPSGTGTYSIVADPELPEATYTARATQTDTAGNIGTSPLTTFTVSLPVTGDDPYIIGAGDITSCGQSPKDAETAAILAEHPNDTVVTLGDNAYDGSAAVYNCYDEFWGQHFTRTQPTIGDHDITGTNSTQSFLNYFRPRLASHGATAVDPRKVYYSYDLGTWHVVHLNAVCFYYTPGCDVPGQESWFRNDLAANPNQCTIVMMSSPRFSSGAIHGNNPDMQNLWRIAYEGGVEAILSGDDHIYERFAPMDSAGNATPNGVRQFIAGTGGYSLYSIGTLRPNSERRVTGSFGVLRVGLHTGSYSWEFLPINGAPAADSGTTNCH